MQVHHPGRPRPQVLCPQHDWRRLAGGHRRAHHFRTQGGWVGGGWSGAERWVAVAVVVTSGGGGVAEHGGVACWQWFPPPACWSNLLWLMLGETQGRRASPPPATAWGYACGQQARSQLQLACSSLPSQGEFETGFERGGQTREHAQLAKTLGVTKLVGASAGWQAGCSCRCAVAAMHAMVVAALVLPRLTAPDRARCPNAASGCCHQQDGRSLCD